MVYKLQAICSESLLNHSGSCSFPFSRVYFHSFSFSLNLISQFVFILVALIFIIQFSSFQPILLSVYAVPLPLGLCSYISLSHSLSVSLFLFINLSISFHFIASLPHLAQTHLSHFYSRMIIFPPPLSLSLSLLVGLFLKLHNNSPFALCLRSGSIS